MTDNLQKSLRLPCMSNDPDGLDSYDPNRNSMRIDQYYNGCVIKALPIGHNPPRP